MKFGIGFANVGPFIHPDPFEQLVRGAEEAGFESLWTVEHVVIPVGYQSPYPYSSSGKIPGPENSPIPDPILPLVYAAAVSSTLKLATGVVILPQRHPTYVAKEMATLDLMSRGRAILGIGIGWLSEEFATLGIPFEERVGRTEESIQAIRALWADAPKPFEGRYYRWDAVESNPKPLQKPGVPIVVGGHADAAARRAARFGDGFFPARPDRLPKLLEVLSDECGKLGRDPAEIELTTMSGGTDLDEVRRLQDLGVSRLVVGPPSFDVEELRRAFGEFADQVIAKL